MKNVVLATVLISACGFTTAAQMEIVEIETPQLASMVAGVVVDSSGGTLPRVTVEERSADWKSVLRSTETDEKGRFRFLTNAEKSTYYLQFSRSGFNWLRLKLQLDKRSPKTLIVKMLIGT